VGFARAAFQVGETFGQIRRTAICCKCCRADGERLDFCTYGPASTHITGIEVKSLDLWVLLGAPVAGLRVEIIAFLQISETGSIREIGTKTTRREAF
jgi:hypothetical protein